MTGNPAWPAFGVAGLAGPLPDAMRVSSPDIDQADPPPVGRVLPLSWEGPYDGDLVLVWLRRETWDGTTYVPQETVSCALVDDGTHTVPHNDARSEVLGVYWAVGFLDAE